MKTNLLYLLAVPLMLTHCSQEKKLLRKASNSVDRGQYEQAIGYYDQIINKDTGSFYGNAGKGIVLSEFLVRHEQAIPYLEKALRNSPKKSKPVINGSLGRSYHYIGNYKRALEYYAKIAPTNDEAYSDYDEFLTKRIADCKYAIAHPEVSLPENASVHNVGANVNSGAPEYAPVYTHDQLIFTSKRQDQPHEKVNAVDGKFYENIYIAKASKQDSGFAKAELFKLPFKNRFRSVGESVASVSPDGETMFIYRAGKIYETKVNDNTSMPKEVDENINESHMLNYAALSPDKQTLFFTREADNKHGLGGTDIYMAKKQSDGTWSEPKVLPYPINTEMDEDAPYMNDNGVLFFASNGHPGYGGFDIFRSQFVNNEWTKPVNLGQPVNSPGDDTYFTLKSNNANGFFASSRPGGFGDMDIYSVHYVITDNPVCSPETPLTIVTENKSGMDYVVSANVPDNMKKDVRNYRWEVNGKPIAQTGDKFEQHFTEPGEYKVAARVVAACDTCPSVRAMCTESLIVVKAMNIDTMQNVASNDNAATNNKKGTKGNQKNNKKNSTRDNSAAVAKNNAKSNSKNSANNVNADENAADRTGYAATGSDTSRIAATDKGGNGRKGARNQGNGSANNDNDPSTRATGSLEVNPKWTDVESSQLRSAGWNDSTAHFALNATDVSDGAKSELKKKAEVLKKKSDLVISITGHADSRGSNDYNRTLSYKRAKAVKEYLISNGVPAKRIVKVDGAGEEQLVNGCSDGVNCSEEQHAQNRRVEIKVMTKTPTQPLTKN